MEKELILTALLSTKGNLSADTLKNLRADTLNNLSAYTLKNLRADTLNNLRADTLNNLSADTLNNLSAYTLNNLSADTLNNLSAYTLKNLSVINDIPKLENPYSNILSDISDKKRTYSQSKWGTITDFDADLNICETEMCIAEHLVNMCGKIGYDLQRKFGWSTAAGLIHLRTFPDAPIFDYNITSNDAGLSYMKMMSCFENRVDRKQNFDEFLKNLLS
ncbi:MAG: hypothetical protein ACRC3K_08340 [Plesiomonas sp.]